MQCAILSDYIAVVNAVTIVAAVVVIIVVVIVIVVTVVVDMHLSTSVFKISD